VKGKTVGVFGTGKIGKIVCEIFNSFRMNVIAFDIYEDKEWASKNNVEYVKSKDDIYARADIISLHAPLTKENYHMINEEAINKMKHGVLILNTGRGALIDTKALIEGIKSNKIGGVAMDVYENEVNVFDKDWYSTESNVCKDDDLNRLLSYPNVLVTSHQAYFTHESLKEIGKVTIDNMIEYLEKSTASTGASDFSLKFEVK
jgi:D-lactate dehydrogenase